MLNASMLLSTYIYPELIKTPFIVLVITFSGLLLRTKNENKQVYMAKVPWYGVLLAIVIPVVFIGLAITGYTEKSNAQFTEASVKYMVLAIGFFVCVVYGWLLFKRESGEKT